MSAISRKLRKSADPATSIEGLSYWCQGCDSLHAIRIKGPGSWGWNGDVERPVFSPSVLVTIEFPADYVREEGDPPARCHTFVGCNGAQPGEVIFLSDCTHALAGTVQPLPDLPAYLLGEPKP